MSEQFLAVAEVAIKPNLAGFRTALKEQVQSSIKSMGVQKIPVQPVMTKFRSTIQNEFRASKPIKVYVALGNSKELRLEVQKALQGVVAKPVAGKITKAEAAAAAAPVAKAPPAVVTPAPVRPGLGVSPAGNIVPAEALAARKAENALIVNEIGNLEELSAVRTRETAAAKEAAAADKQAANQEAIALKEAEKAAKAKAAAEAKDAEATKVRTAAQKEAIAEDKLRTEALLRLRGAQREYDASQVEGLSLAERRRALEATVKAANTGAVRTTEQLIRGQATLNAEEKAVLSTREGELVQLKETAAQELRTVVALEQEAAIRQELNLIIGEEDVLRTTEVQSIKSAALAHEAENDATAIAAKLKRQEGKARAINADELAAEIKVRRDNVIALRAELEAQRELLKAQEASAVTAAARREQALRGGGAAIGTRLGLRGATLAAGGPFLIGTAATVLIAKAVQEASDLNEEINKSRVIFKQSAAQIDEWAKGTARSLGISEVEALRAAGNFGSILVPLGVLPGKAAILSEQLVTLASDMASFNNVSPDRALEALRAGLVGQSRPLRTLGVQLTAARVQEEAFRETGKRHAAELTQQDKVLARYTLILRDAAIQQGDFARTSGRLANQARILKAQLSDLGATTGTVLTPFLTDSVKGLNTLIHAISVTSHAIGSLGDAFINVSKHGQDARKSVVKTVSEFVEGASRLILFAPSILAGPPGGDKNTFSLSLEDATKKLQDFRAEAVKFGGRQAPAAIAEFTDKVQNLITVLNQGGPSGRRFAKALATVLADVQRTGNIPLNIVPKFQLALTDIKVQESGVLGEIGADFNTTAANNPVNVKVPIKITLDASIAVAEAFGAPGQQVSALRQIADQQRRTLIRQLGLESNASNEEILAAATPAELKRRERAGELGKKRVQAIQQTANDFKQTNDQIAGIKSKQASDTKAASQKIKDANSKADQALLDSISSEEQALTDQQTEAAVTRSQRDDEKITRRLIAFYKAKINEIRKRVHDANTARDQIRSLQEKLFQAQRDLVAEAAQQRALAVETGEQRIANQAELASETTTLRDDAAIARRRVAFYKHRIDIVKKTVHDAEQAAAELKDLRQKLFDAEAQQREAKRNLHQQQLANRQEAADLRVQIAADTGNRKKEIAAREAQIRLTEQLIRQQRRGSLARLRLIAQLRQEQKELKDLRDAQKKSTEAQKSAQFAFLEAQSGFAANLLGNLIPLAATGGLVGGQAGASTHGGGGVVTGSAGGGSIGGFAFAGSQAAAGQIPPPERRGISDFGNADAAARRGLPQGPTRVGQATTNQLLRGILDVLSGIHEKTKHPEAHRRRIQNRGVNDFTTLHLH